MMQDRFKFRIFEKPTKIMHELNAVGYSDFDPSGQGISHLIMIPAGIQNTYAYNKTCLYNQENFSEPMQCTELKDKNGKLIYEGDIVKTTFSCDKGIEHSLLECVWDDKKCAIGFKSPKGNMEYVFEYYEPNENEVIGNIYENPELLKDGEQWKKNV